MKPRGGLDKTKRGKSPREPTPAPGKDAAGAAFSSGAPAPRAGAAAKRSPWKRGIRSHIGFHEDVRGRILMKDLNDATSQQY